MTLATQQQAFTITYRTRPISVATWIQAGIVALFIVAASICHWWASSAHAAAAVTNDTIANVIIDHIRTIAIEDNLLDPETDDLSVEIQYIPEGPKHFYGDMEGNEPIAITAKSTLERQFRHQAYIRLKLAHPSGESHTLGVPVKITVTKPVWVANKQIPAGEKLSTKNLVVERRTLTHELSKAIPASNKLNNHVARLMILEDDILKSHQLTVPLAVRSQGFVKIQMAAPHGVRMMLEGKALEDGHIGDLIRVRNRLNPDRLYTAKVIGPNRVSVTL